MAIHVIEKQATKKLVGMQAADDRATMAAGRSVTPEEAMAEIDKAFGNQKPQPVANGQLVAFLERIERVEEDKRNLSEDLKEIYAEAKGDGWDTKMIRRLIKLRRMDEKERMQADQLLESYMRAAGMAVQTSMGF